MLHPSCTSINHSEIFDHAQDSTAFCQVYIPYVVLHDSHLFCELENTQNRDFRSARDRTSCSMGIKPYHKKEY
jgi:hypothetical protein